MLTSRLLTQRLLLLSTALALSACGGNPTPPAPHHPPGHTAPDPVTPTPPPNPGGPTSKHGLILVSETYVARSFELPIVDVNAAASFVQLHQRVQDPQQLLNTRAESCEVISGNQLAPAQYPPRPIGTPLDAGPSVKLDYPVDGTRVNYATLMPLPGQVAYGASTAQGGLEPIPVPTLLASTSGSADVPALQNVSFPEYPVLVSFNIPPGAPIAAESTFSWTQATGNANTLVFFQAIDSSGPNNAPATLLCFAHDDGRFTLPAATQRELQELNFVGELFTVGRAAFKQHVQGDLIITTGLLRAEVFIPALMPPGVPTIPPPPVEPQPPLLPDPSVGN